MSAEKPDTPFDEFATLDTPRAASWNKDGKGAYKIEYGAVDVKMPRKGDLVEAKVRKIMKDDIYGIWMGRCLFPEKEVEKEKPIPLSILIELNPAANLPKLPDDPSLADIILKMRASLGLEMPKK